MTIKNLLGHSYFYLFLASSWTVLIGALCLIRFNDLPSIKIGGFDKYIHFVFHFVFALLWILYFEKRKSNNIITKVLFYSISYGISIEFAQEYFTTTRKADIMDVLANISGCITAIILILAFQTYKKRIIKKLNS